MIIWYNIVIMVALLLGLMTLIRMSRCPNCKRRVDLGERFRFWGLNPFLVPTRPCEGCGTQIRWKPWAALTLNMWCICFIVILTLTWVFSAFSRFDTSVIIRVWMSGLAILFFFQRFEAVRPKMIT